MIQARTLLATALLIFISLSVTSAVVAQSELADDLAQTLTLSPRAERGSIQTYVIDIETIYLDDSGTPKTRRVDRMGLTKLCLANAPDTGLVYQLTIDSLLTGQIRELDAPNRKLFDVEQYKGKTFTSRFTGKLPAGDSCYALDIDFPEGERFIETLLIQETLLTENLLERFRYMAGRQLKSIGDMVTIRFPKPICFSVPTVVTEFTMQLAAFDLRLEGVTLVNGSPCAILRFQPHFVKLDIDLAPVGGSYLAMRGLMSRHGDYCIRLSDGDIVSARIYDRVDGQSWSSATPADSSASHSYRTINIQQLN